MIRNHDLEDYGIVNSEALIRMSNAMEAYPPAFQGNHLNLLFLDDIVPIRKAREYLQYLDSPNLCEDRREYLFSNDYELWPFPSHSIIERPEPRILSDRLYERFDEAGQILPTQRDIGRIICEKASKCQPDIIVLMIVDGLSYYDLPDKPENKPCLVNGVSLTQFGYPEVIGKPTVSERLFSLGYIQQLGFTYFDVETNPLANQLFGVFGSNQIKRVSKFDECLESINNERLSHGFIQITLAGLDELCHHHHDEPPVQYYIESLLKRFYSVIESLNKSGRHVLACLTADHGILWRQNLESEWTVLDDLHPDDVRSPRYIHGCRKRNYVLVKSCNGSIYSMLNVPYLTRKLRNNEWGVHGGISAWESLVPLIIQIT